MKTIILIFITLILAEPISQSDIHTVARNVYTEFNKNIESNRFELKNIEIVKEKNIDLMYIYHLNPIGFILISADNNSYPVIGYSFDNNFRTQNMPINMNWMFENTKKNILYSIETVYIYSF